VVQVSNKSTYDFVVRTVRMLGPNRVRTEKRIPELVKGEGDFASYDKTHALCQIHLYQFCMQVATDALPISSWGVRKHPQPTWSETPLKTGHQDGQLGEDALKDRQQNDQGKLPRPERYQRVT